MKLETGCTPVGRSFTGCLLYVIVAGSLLTAPAFAAPPVANSSFDRLHAQDLSLFAAREDGGRVAETAIRRIESGYLGLLDRDPKDDRTAEALGDFYGRWGWKIVSPSPAALRLVAGSQNPVRLALQLAPWPSSKNVPPSTSLLVAALAARPEAVALWLAAAESGGHPAWSIALAEEAVRRLSQKGEGGEHRRLTAAAAELELRYEIDSGLLSRAAARLNELPAGVRAIVESGESGPVQAVMEGLAWNGELRDVRLDLALLRLAAGDMPALPPPAKVEPGSFDESWRQLLQLSQEPSKDDPFDLFVSVVTLSWDVENIGLDAGHLKLAAQVARREHYGAFAAFFERSAAHYLRESLASSAPELAGGVVPPALAAAVPKLAQEISAEANRLEESAGHTEAETNAALGPDPAAEVIDRLLREPRLSPWAERPLPAGLKPCDPDSEAPRAEEAWAALPASFELVRFERSGSRIVAVGQSQDYDWVGPYAEGAYWVILSSDGGATWSHPLYTGLRVGEPYEVCPASDLTLLARDHLQVEAKNTGTEDNLYLDIPLESLTRDSDGDGLTDLAEERLLTDPFAADTDQDGVPDGQDSLPQVAMEPGGSAVNLAMAALFQRISSDQGWAGSGTPAPLGDQTYFWIGDRQLFRAVAMPTVRLVVLTRNERQRAEAKLGPFWAFEQDLFVLDRSARHAFAVWSAPMHGEVVRLEESGGVWSAEQVTDWHSF